MFTDAGPFRRELYRPHVEFFAASAKYREVCFLAANRTGKTEAGTYEDTLHATGLYPDWWPGKRFDHPTKGWIAGESNIWIREVLQEKLLGPPGAEGTGMIPGDLIEHTTRKAGTVATVDQIYVRHKSGLGDRAISTIGLKSYKEGRKAFQGAALDYFHGDEETPQEIYTEALTRTMTTGGICYLTFTPLLGLTPLVLQFMPGGVDEVSAARCLVTCTWDDVPHLSAQAKAELLASYPEYQRDARSKGVPQLGSGAIYPYGEQMLVVPDFVIPDHWPRCYGLDVGWNITAAVWLAQDRDAGVYYAWSEHYAGREEPSMHAAAIRGRGEWIPGVIDPAARGRSQIDGETLIQNYRDLGLDIEPAVHAVEAGIYQVWDLFGSGRLKLFASLVRTLEERRLYRRDEKGGVVKERDHAMDALRYAVVTGRERMRTKPAKRKPADAILLDLGNDGTSWMG